MAKGVRGPGVSGWRHGTPSALSRLTAALAAEVRIERSPHEIDTAANATTPTSTAAAYRGADVAVRARSTT